MAKVILFGSPGIFPEGMFEAGHRLNQVILFQDVGDPDPVFGLFGTKGGPPRSRTY